MLSVGLRCYGVYKFDKFPEWTIVIHGFGENELGEWLEGYAFDDNGKFITGVNLKLPMEYTEIGYIYTPVNGYRIVLEKLDK
jgi:hypothetical protein